MDIRYMLDTNTASYIIKGTYPAIHKKLASVPMTSVCISSVTEGELLFGLAKKSEATNLKIAVHEFLLRVEILPWDSYAAQSYAHLRSQIEQNGFSLGTLNMMIAAHSLATHANLITSDQAFYKLKKFLTLADWSKAH